jgi:hypothetical protein
MSSQAILQTLVNAIHQTKFITVRSSGYDVGALSVLCRVAEGAEKEWMMIISRLLEAQELSIDQPFFFDIDIGKKYFRKRNPDGMNPVMVYAWVIQLRSKKIEDAVVIVSSVLRGEPLSVASNNAKEVTVMPFTGMDPNKYRGSVSSKGKGVHAVGDREYRPR